MKKLFVIGILGISLLVTACHPHGRWGNRNYDYYSRLYYDQNQRQYRDQNYTSTLEAQNASDTQS